MGSSHPPPRHTRQQFLQILQRCLSVCIAHNVAQLSRVAVTHLSSCPYPVRVPRPISLRAETESALASRLSKFLSGCDSFYDEPPLSVAMKFVSAASKDQREPMVTDKRARAATGVARPGDTDDSSSTVSAPRAETVAGRKRPAPTGGLSGSRIFDGAGGGAADAGVTAEGKGDKDTPGIARPDDVDEGKTCGGHGDSRPAKHERLQEEFAAGHQKCDKRSAADEPNAEENSQHHVDEEGNDDGFMAPSFLTPPLPVVTAGVGGSGGGGGADVLHGVAPPSACSSAGSTPSNGSSSPALAVASPAPNASQRCGGGRTGGVGAFVADRRRYAAHAAALSEDRPSLSSSPTPPSTREPSPPPLSTQEESLSPEENGEEEGDDVANHDGRNKARKGRGAEERGRGAEDVGRAFGKSSGHGYKNAADDRGTAGTLAVPKGFSSFSGFVMRASTAAGGGGQAAGVVGDADDTYSRAEEEDDSEQAQERVGDTEEEEEEDVDMHDTADTIEESLGAAAPAAEAEAAVTERQMGEVENANSSKTRRAADDAKQMRDESQESEELAVAEPFSGSQGGAGADEAGGAETETETGGNQLVGGRIAHSV